MAHNKLYRNFIILQEDERSHGISEEKPLSGYAKIEAKSDKCKISFYAQNLNKDDKYTIVLICYKKDFKQIVDLGSLEVTDVGKGEACKEYYINNIAGLDFSYEKISGAAICKYKDGELSFLMYGFMNGENVKDGWKKSKVLKHTDKDDKTFKMDVPKVEGTFIKEKESKKEKEIKEDYINKQSKHLEKTHKDEGECKSYSEDECKNMIGHDDKESMEYNEKIEEKHMSHHKEDHMDKHEEEHMSHHEEDHMKKPEGHMYHHEEDHMKKPEGHMYHHEEDYMEKPEGYMNHHEEGCMDKPEGHMHHHEEDHMEKPEGHMHNHEEDYMDKPDGHMYHHQEDHMEKPEGHMYHHEEDHMNKTEGHMHHHEKDYMDKHEEEYMHKHKDDEYKDEYDYYGDDEYGIVGENYDDRRESASKFDQYESSIEKNKDSKETFELSGEIGKFFSEIMEGFEEYQPRSKDIKHCKWYKVNVKSLDDMCNISNYNKYTVAYYPMLNYYPYIRKYGYFMIGYKCDPDGNLKYIVYGVPGKKDESEQPYAGKTGFVTWMRNGNQDEGSWLMFYDFRNSTIVVPMK